MHLDTRKGSSSVKLAVHRCRFVDYAPSAITALAFPPVPLPSVQRKTKKASGKQPQRYGTLAVGHANGNIDLCEWVGPGQSGQCPQAWVTKKIMPGPYPSKVDSLAFVIRYPDDFGADDVPSISDLRLFSSGGGSELLEWNLERSCVKRTISSQGGAIWCVVANPASTLLALGCEDGTVRLLSVVNDTLMHYRRFDRTKSRILSIAWGPPLPRKVQEKPRSPENGNSPSDNDSNGDSDDDEDDWKDSWLITGCSDSSLRKWDVQTGRVLERMAVDKIRGERTLVWVVGALGDGTMISGDSLGHVKFWDSRTCTPLHSFQAHGADVLALCIGPEGKAVYTSGVDQKTVQFSLVKTNYSASRLRWTQSSSRRMHSHDVRALVSWPPYTPLPQKYRRTYPIEMVPILASGGLDMSVVLSPAALPESTVVKMVNPLATSTEATFGDAYHRKLSYPIGNAIRVSKNKRMVLCLREAGLSVWRISKKPEVEIADEDREGEAEPWNGGWEKVLEMDLNIISNLVAGDISEDGKWLAVSDMYETKLFSIHAEDQDQISVKRIKDFPALIHSSIPNASGNTSTGATALRFAPDLSKLVLSTALTSYVLVFDLTGDKPRLLRRFEHHRLKEAVIGGRAVKLLKEKKQLNGVLINGTGAHQGEDVEMGATEGEENISEETNEGTDSSDEDEGDDDSGKPTADIIPNVLQIAISPDGQWLTTSDDQKHTHVFNLDTISHHGLLPTFSLSVQSFVFSPTNPNLLFIAFPDNTLQVYDVEARQFPKWSQDLSPASPSASPVARRLAALHDPILGICFPPPSTSLDSPDAMDTDKETTRGDLSGSRYALLWGSTWMIKLPLSLTSTGHSFKANKKRQRGEKNQQEHFDMTNVVVPGEESLTNSSSRLITHFRPVLHVDFLGDGELVVVERPLVDVLSMLPPAYFGHKYGAS